MPFTTVQRRMLEKVAGYLLPGAAELGVADYIEKLLDALESDPPRIYAGGPFSGRMPKVVNGQPSNEFPENEFQNFLPLTRMQLLAWEARLKGTRHVQTKMPETHFTRNYDGYRAIIERGISQALRLQADRRMPPASVDLFMAMDGDCRKLLEELTIEAAFSAPEYGGNQPGTSGPAGWAQIGYAGDSMPRGYSLYDAGRKEYRELPEAPVSKPDPGADAHPLGTLGRLFLWLNTIFNQGKKFK